MDMNLSNDAIAWIERRLGGRVVDIQQQVRWRPHHFVTLECGSETRTVLARGEREPDMVAQSRYLSHFDIAREARVLEALQGHGLKVPEFFGYNDEHRLILMEKVAGTNLLADASDDATRLTIMKEYFEELARLHSLDVETMKLTGIDIPMTPEEVAFAGKFRFMEDDYRGLKPSLRPEPLLDLGIWWLHENVPRGSRPLSFVQGDTGPGQFMFASGSLTALIDWEMAHIADPMLDLAVVRMRNMLYPTGPLREPIAHYEMVSDRPIDWSVLSFYTVLTMLLTPMGVAKSVQRPSVRVDSQMARFGWYVTLRRGLCDALGEALSFDIDPPELPSEGTYRGDGLARYLAQLLDVNCRSIARDDHERAHIDSSISVARTLERESAFGARLLADDLDDMAEVLGRRPCDRADGILKLDELVAHNPEDHIVALVRLFARIERRREFLWEPLMIAQESAPFERLGSTSR